MTKPEAQTRRDRTHANLPAGKNRAGGMAAIRHWDFGLLSSSVIRASEFGLKSFLLAALFFILAGVAQAQDLTHRPVHWAQKLEVPGVNNCYQVSTNLYRGARPTAEGMKHLQALGVRTVINLQVLRSDRQEMRGTGLKSLHFGMVPWRADSDEVVKFLKAVTDTNSLPAFVHCQYGADRTGLMCAMYRIVVCGWTKQEAIAEMKNGGFHFSWNRLVSFIEKADIADIKRRVGCRGNKKRGWKVEDGGWKRKMAFIAGRHLPSSILCPRRRKDYGELTR